MLSLPLFLSGFRSICFRFASVCGVTLLYLSSGCSPAEPPTEAELQTLTDEGILALQTYSFDSAYETLSEVHRAISPKDPAYVKVTYCLALATWHKRPPSASAIEEAKELFHVVVELSPNSEWGASALLELGRMHEVSDFNADPPDPESAIRFYEMARSLGFPRIAEADTSLWQYGLLAEESGEDLLAAEVFTELVREYPRSLYGTLAWERVQRIANQYPEANIEVSALAAIQSN